jgi:2-keto-4-pentenoate hydratase/2-oxohepta-3-ene-1,7-dioic acid hydratase in catechol pathway
MKLVTFDEGRVGRLDGPLVIELACSSTRQFFERQGRVPETGARLPLDRVRLRAPIVPRRLLHTTGNFIEHHRELSVLGPPAARHTLALWQNGDAVIGPDDPIRHPSHLTSELDYELELAIIIGGPCGAFGPGEAAEHIAGYTIFNDITARDIQRRELELGSFPFSKTITTFCPMGPWVVTADEVGDPHSLAMELRVNGEVRQTGHTSQMILSIPQLVSYHSGVSYRAGDVLTTGTVSGVAAAQPNPSDFYLRPGDVVESRIEKLGILRNTVVPWLSRRSTMTLEAAVA